MPELILKLGLPRMQNHKVKVGSFGYLKDYCFFGQLFRFWCRILDNASWQHGHCHSATIDWVLNHRMRP